MSYAWFLRNVYMNTHAPWASIHWTYKIATSKVKIYHHDYTHSECCVAKPYFGHLYHDDVIKWKHFPRYWPFVRGIHRSPVNSPHKGHWRGALMFSLICVWINGWVNNHEAGDLRRYRAHYDVMLMIINPDYLDYRNARQSAEPAMNTQNQVGFLAIYLVISKFESCFFLFIICVISWDKARFLSTEILFAKN